MTFLLAMLLYPEVQKKAQQEIDRVLGPDAFPELSDRESMPYLNCILKEAFR
jgi:cytochrome P450